jgi:cyclopropane fatty-acyl-phospholipid synthase-like methyltransferase
MESNCSEWFRTWFDSPYYKILYSHRSEEEAALFIDNLLAFIDLPDRSRVLDLACGRGRHSVYLNEKGFNVIGIDLSNNSISDAKKHENATLHFLTEDMRSFDLGVKFEAIFNLFTSFGYFESQEENKKVLQRIQLHLKENGLFVMDYFNATKVERGLIPFETKTIQGVEFNISKKIENGQIIKTISFEGKEGKFEFEEKVQLLKANEILEMISGQGLKIVRTFGDYFLNDFDEANSDRIIVIASN